MEKQPFSLARMGLTLFVFIGVLLGILLARSPVFSNANAKTSTLALQTVATQKVQYQDSYQYQRYFIGQVEAKQRSQLGFEIGGAIKNITFDEGDIVKAKEVLASLDITRLNANKKQAEANLALAKANAKLATTTYKRVFGAHKANAVTDQEKDEAREGRDTSKAAEAVAKAQLETILVDIEKAKLLAPFDGVVINRMVDEGRVVMAGQSILEIQKKDNFEVRVGVTTDIANQLVTGTKQSLLINGKNYQALVKAVLPIRAKARTIDVILAIEHQETSLRSGDVARLLMEYQIKKRGFWVPISALVEGKRGLWSLYALDDENRVEPRSVILHYTNNTHAFVSGAVDRDETIVVEGASKLVPYQQIQKVAGNDN